MKKQIYADFPDTIKKRANWKFELKLLKQEYIKKTSPGFFELSGGYNMKIMPYKDNTANGLTKCIIDWINFSGGNANRINVQGQVRVERLHLAFGKYRDNIRYTSSNTNKGTADVHAVINGRHVSIEVKIGNDKLSEHQLNEMKKIINAGGLYYVAKDMQGFVAWWTNELKKIMLASLEKSMGIVNAAAKRTKIDRSTHYRWLAEDTKYKSQVEDIADVALDFAESKLHTLIRKGDTAATIFYLKTKGKKRGYIERSEVDIHKIKIGKELHDELEEVYV